MKHNLVTKNNYRFHFIIVTFHWDCVAITMITVNDNETERDFDIILISLISATIMTLKIVWYFSHWCAVMIIIIL